jgi:hypothetical protein
MSGEARVNWLLAARMLLTRLGSGCRKAATQATGHVSARGLSAANRSDIVRHAAAARGRGRGHLVVAAEGPRAIRCWRCSGLGQKDEYRKSDCTG